MEDTVTRIFNGHMQRFFTAEDMDAEIAWMIEDPCMALRWWFGNGRVVLDVTWCGKPFATYLA